MENDRYRFSPAWETNNWVAQVWEHPLVTKETRVSRQIARATIQAFMDEHQQSRDTYTAVPVGSLLWMPYRKQTDFDYVLFTQNPEQAARLEHIFRLDYQEKVGMNIFGPTSLEELQTDQGTLARVTQEQPLSLLFTPDEYLAGSTELAHTIRLMTLRAIAQEANPEAYWSNTVGKYFNTFFVNWDSDKRTLFRGEKHGEESRVRRLNNAIEARAGQTRNPERWKSSFLQKKASIHIPSFPVYASALRASKGASPLLPRLVLTSQDVVTH